MAAFFLFQQDGETQQSKNFKIFVLRKAGYPRIIDDTEFLPAFQHVALGT